MAKAEETRASISAIDVQILSIGKSAGALSIEALERLTVMLRVHAAAVRDARADLLTIRGPVWRSVEAISGHLATCIGPLALERIEVLLPMGVARHAGRTHVRRAEGEASVVDYAEAVTAIFAWEATVGRHVLLRALIQKRLAAIAAGRVARIERHLNLTNEADIPDFRGLGREILHAEVAEWVLSIAGAPEHSTAILQRLNRAARESLAWAGRVFERFRVTPDEFSHFDAVATLAAVDELLLVILRVHDSDRVERAAGSHPFVMTIGQQAVQEFVTGLEHMTGRYLDIAEHHLLQDGAAGAFVNSVLQVLQRILRLGHHLAPLAGALDVRFDHDETVSRMVAIRDRLRAAVGKDGGSRDRFARLDAVEAGLARLRPGAADAS